MCKKSKKVVGEAKRKAYEDFYNRLDSRYGEKNIYKIAKMREIGNKWTLIKLSV